jgi:hypothetical protein
MNKLCKLCKLIKKYSCTIITILCICIIIITLYNSGIITESFEVIKEDELSNTDVKTIHSKLYNTGTNTIISKDKKLYQDILASNICYNTYEQIAQLKPCISRVGDHNDIKLPNKPFNISNCNSEQLGDVYSNFPHSLPGMSEEEYNEMTTKYTNDTIIPWAKEQDYKNHQIYDKDSKSGDLKCNRGKCYIENNKYICLDKTVQDTICSQN